MFLSNCNQMWSFFADMHRSPEAIQPVGAMVIACRYTDITKLRGPFHDYMNAPHHSVHTHIHVRVRTHMRACLREYGCWDSKIGIVTVLWDTHLRSKLQKYQEIFLPQNIQTCDPAYYSVGTEFFLWGKATGV